MPDSAPPVQDSPAAAGRPVAPQTVWTQLTDAPLAGLALAGEAGLILAWDQAQNIYLFDWSGNCCRRLRPPTAIHDLVISDDGSQIVLANREGHLWWLDPELKPQRQHQGPRHLIGLAISPLGRFLAATSSSSHTYVYDCFGRPVTELVTQRPLKHMAFLAARALLVGAAEYALAGCYDLDGQVRWQDALWSSAGHLCASGEGFAILVSCYGHGLQRYALDGTNEGAYHLGGGVARAAIDYDGKRFAAATLEGDLLVVNAAGHVLWRQTLPQPAMAVSLDPSGRLLVYGQQSGMITALDLFAATDQKQPAAAEGEQQAVAVGQPAATVSEPSESQATHRPTSPATAGRPHLLRSPAWSVPLFASQSEAQTAALAVLDDPPGVAVLTTARRLQVFDRQGQLVFKSEKLAGVGRFLQTGPDLIVAATDRHLALFYRQTAEWFLFPSRMVDLSEVEVDAATAELTVLEEGDRVGRYDLRGRRRWVVEMEAAVDSLTLGRDGTCAVSTLDGRLVVLDRRAHTVGQFSSAQREPLAVVALGLHWFTLATQSQWVRCHSRDGTVLWEKTIPCEAWRIGRLGDQIVARAAGNRTFLFSPDGQLTLDTGEVPSEAVLIEPGPGQPEPAAAYWSAGNLMVSDLSGRILWRHVASGPGGPLAAARAGIACAVGRELAFFPFDQPSAAE